MLLALFLDQMYPLEEPKYPKHEGLCVKKQVLIRADDTGSSPIQLNPSN